MVSERPPGRSLSLLSGAADEPSDPRVAAVLEVLGGRSTADVAREWAVDTAVLHRWVRDFVGAGTAQVTNQPVDNEGQQRDRFLAAFAHEVRTPLAIAQGWLEMLTDEDLPAATIGRAVERLGEALERLAERTLDVQLLASASMGRLRLEPWPVTVGQLVAMLPGSPDIHGEGPEVRIEVDPELFPRILRDLWEAASASPAPRSMRLVVSTVAPWIELRVEREADPIDVQVLRALFDPFDLNDDATGITIGLYLARALAVAHGGTIGVEQDDDGAAFWVRVPIIRAKTSPRP